MRKEYIPMATSATIYYEPQTQQDFDQLIEKMKVGDMIFNKWVFQASGGMWYVMGLMDETDPTTKMLFPNIILGEYPHSTEELPKPYETLKPLSRWGIARMDYLKEHNKFLAMQLGTVGLHKHCLEIEEQTAQRKRDMIAAIRKDPANKVTERDKAADPMAWVGRMNNFQAMVHETIYADLIYA